MVSDQRRQDAAAMWLAERAGEWAQIAWDIQPPGDARGITEQHLKEVAARAVKLAAHVADYAGVRSGDLAGLPGLGTIRMATDTVRGLSDEALNVFIADLGGRAALRLKDAIALHAKFIEAQRKTA